MIPDKSGLPVIGVPGPIDSVCRIEAQIDGILNQTRTQVDCAGATLGPALQEKLQRLIRAVCSKGSKVTSIEFQVLFLASSKETCTLIQQSFTIDILFCLRLSFSVDILLCPGTSGDSFRSKNFEEILKLLKQKCKAGSDGPPISFLGLKGSLLSQDCGQKLLDTLQTLSSSDEPIVLELMQVFFLL